MGAPLKGSLRVAIRGIMGLYYRGFNNDLYYIFGGRF